MAGWPEIGGPIASASGKRDNVIFGERAPRQLHMTVHTAPSEVRNTCVPLFNRVRASCAKFARTAAVGMNIRQIKKSLTIVFSPKVIALDFPRGVFLPPARLAGREQIRPCKTRFLYAVFVLLRIRFAPLTGAFLVLFGMCKPVFFCAKKFFLSILDVPLAVTPFGFLGVCGVPFSANQQNLVSMASVIPVGRFKSSFSVLRVLLPTLQPCKFDVAATPFFVGRSALVGMSSAPSTARFQLFLSAGHCYSMVAREA